MLKKLLAHPLTHGLDPDDPQTTILRRHIIREKAFLRKMYTEWYDTLCECIPSAKDVPGAVVELGSGGGGDFLRERIKEGITSEVFPCAHVDMVFDGCHMPFADCALRALVLVDVLHHIPDPAAFFSEAVRTLASGGVIVMIEPWNTLWGRFVYQYFHPEPFMPEQGMNIVASNVARLSQRWAFPSSGPLSGANGALPWIIFQRDAALFANFFPQLRVEHLVLDYPFSYLASGGVSMRTLSPGWSYSLWRKFENAVQCLRGVLAMFAVIVIRKN